MDVQKSFHGTCGGRCYGYAVSGSIMVLFLNRRPSRPGRPRLYCICHSRFKNPHRRKGQTLPIGKGGRRRSRDGALSRCVRGEGGKSAMPLAGRLLSLCANCNGVVVIAGL